MTGEMESEREIRLSENLKKIMASKNLKVTVVARKVGMNKSTLHGYCNGVIPRNLRQLKLLADFLEISFSELIFGKSGGAFSIRAIDPLEGRYELTIKELNDSTKKVETAK